MSTNTMNETLNFSYECNLLNTGLYEVKKNQFMNSIFYNKSILNKICGLVFDYPIKEPKIKNKFKKEEVDVIKNAIIQSLGQKIILALYLSLLDNVFKNLKMNKRKKLDIADEDMIFIYYITDIFAFQMKQNDFKEILDFEKTFNTVNNIYKYIANGLRDNKIRTFLEKVFRSALAYHAITNSKNFLELGVFDFYEPAIEFYEIYANRYTVSRGKGKIYAIDLFDDESISYKTFDEIKITYYLLVAHIYEDLIESGEDPYFLLKSRENQVYVKLIEKYLNNSIYNNNLVHIKNFIEDEIPKILKTIEKNNYISRAEEHDLNNYKKILMLSSLDNKFLSNSALSYFFADLSDFIRKNNKDKNFKSNIINLINRKFVLLKKLIDLYDKNNYYVNIDENVKNKIKRELLEKIKNEIKKEMIIYTETFQHIWDYILFILSLKVMKNIELKDKNNISCDDINTFVKNSAIYIKILQEILPDIKNIYLNIAKNNKKFEVMFNE